MVSNNRQECVFFFKSQLLVDVLLEHLLEHFARLVMACIGLSNLLSDFFSVV